MKKIIVLILISFLLSISTVRGAVTSLSEVDMISDYKELDGPVWICDWTEVGTSDELYGFADSTEIKTDDKQANEDLRIEADTTENYAKYKITAEFDKPVVATVGIEKKWFWGWDKDSADEMYEDCKEDANYFYSRKEWGNAVTGYNVICANDEEKLGTIGKIHDKRVLFKTEFEVTPSGKPSESGTITNEGGKSGTEIKLGDNVWIQWLGNLVSGKQPEDPDYVRALFSQAGWIVVDRTEYETDYLDWLGPGGDLKGCVDDISEGDKTVEQCEDEFNKDARGAASEDTTDPFVTQGISVINENSIRNGQIKVDLDNKLQYPRFRLFVDTDYLTIYLPTGEPEIVDVSSDKFTEGTTGKIKAEVKNVGDGTGSFSAWAVCKDPFEYADIVHFFKLDAGETKTVWMDISMSAEDRKKETVSGSCTVYMKERTTMEIDNEDVSVSADLIKKCTPGNRVCSGNLIKECNEAGQKYEVVKRCEHGCEIVGGLPRCKEIVEKEKICNDGIDNDDDALVDCGDPDCDGKQCNGDKTCKDTECVAGGCPWWDIGCHLRMFWVWLTESIKTGLMYLGIFIVIILIIFIVWKVASVRYPMVPGPPRPYFRGRY